MNKKIFTLLVGAGILISSLFTVNAQVLPYSQKPSNDITTMGKAYFNDILTADPVEFLSANYKNYKYVLSVTGLANPTLGNSVAEMLANSLGNYPNGPGTAQNIISRDSSIVLFVDSVYGYNFDADGVRVRQGMARLRLDFIAKLDSGAYGFYGYEGMDPSKGTVFYSKKFQAIRRASWCLDYNYAPNVIGSNVVFDFTNTATGLKLAVPDIKDDRTVWNYPGSTYNNAYYNKAIDLSDRDKMYGSWRFSQTIAPSQPVQDNMPLYIYTQQNPDTISVLVLNIDSAYLDPRDLTNSEGTVGGYTVTMKNVSVNDLILDATGAVRLRNPSNPSAKFVENVLLFTLKKVNTFVMNADDWNAVSLTKGIGFNPNANLFIQSQNNSTITYRNPFMEFKLKAYEVNDSLYHFGYMNFQATDNSLASGGTANDTRNSVLEKFMYVDTGFVNQGNNQYLAFGFDTARRDNTETGALVKDAIYATGTPFVTGSADDDIRNVLLWGDSFKSSTIGCWTATDGVLDKAPYKWAACPKPDVYWRMDSIVWALVEDVADQIKIELGDPSLKMKDLFVFADLGGARVLRYIGPNVYGIQFDLQSVFPPVFTPGSLAEKYHEIYYEYVTELGGNIIVPYGSLVDEIYNKDSGLGGPEYWGLEQYTSFLRNPFRPSDGSNFLTGFPTPGLGFEEGSHYLERDIDNYESLYGPNYYAAQRAIYDSYLVDSVSFIYAYMKDSIMENQSKFRVVYDPYEDETYINVYQSRVRHPDMTDTNYPVWPEWWKNSFGQFDFNATDLVDADGNSLPPGTNVFMRPSDIFTRSLYGNLTWNHTVFGLTPPTNISEAAAYYYNNVILPMYALPTNNRADVQSPYINLLTNYYGRIEGHGFHLNGEYQTVGAYYLPQSLFNFHSFMEWWPYTRYSPMDKVMISTADTVRLYEDYWTNNNPAALSHIYGWSLNQYGEAFFKDSLLYVDIHALGNSSIITLDQTYNNYGEKGIDTKISLSYGMTCTHGEGTKPEQPDKAWIPNDLYLIRNIHGEYLCVPIWSIQDSVYWVTPKEGENPSLMPCYQWAIINHPDNTPDHGGDFTLINREFEKVRFEGIFLPKTTSPTSSVFYGLRVVSGTSYTDYGLSAAFNTEPVVNKYNTNEIDKVPLFGTKFIPKLFGPEIAARFPLDNVSFLGLHTNVKGDYLLGYKYVAPDSTFLNVYAFKYLNSLSLNDPRFINWFYETDNNDSTLYARGRNYYDRLYFQLEEMNGENMTELTNLQSNAANPGFGTNLDNFGQGMVRLNKNTTATNNPLYQFFIDNRHTAYQNADSLVVERYGFYTNKTSDGGQNTTSPEISGLKPLVRQAYNLLLKDNYRWHPTILGHYMTVGQVDRYMLADKLYARQDYVAPGPGEPNLVEGLFGVPHFYFRNSLFDIEKPGDDYFAMIQRLDTFGTTRGFGEYHTYSDPDYQHLESFLTKRFGSVAALKVLRQIQFNREFGLFNVFVEDATAALYLVVRGDGAERLSTFQLVTDDDPVYRRFHVNEPNEQFGAYGDYPDTLEFRLHNDEIDKGRHLYENYGNYDGIEPVNINDLSVKDGASGGRDENLDVNLVTGLGMYQRDSLNYVISFLGMNWKSEYGDSTKYGLYVDTAYINRGTGWIKPQYLLAVDPYFPKQVECVETGTQAGQTIEILPQVTLARYMFNTAQYAKEVDRVYDGDSWTLLTPDAQSRIPLFGTGSTDPSAFEICSYNFNKVEPINPEIIKKSYPYGAPYLWAAKHERIAFAWAIHRGDSLIVLKNLPPFYPNEPYADFDPAYIWDLLLEQYGSEKSNGTSFIKWDSMIAVNRIPGSAYTEFYYPKGDATNIESATVNQGAENAVMRTYYKYRNVAGTDTIGIQAIVALNDNTHKDWVWSMRYIERGASDFVIESETTNRLTKRGAMILPGYGGWMKFENGVPVISRTDAVEVMSDSYGAVFNVKQVTTPGQVVGTEQVAANSDIRIIGGAGTVTILNAAGKSVIINNVLGQTLVSTTLKSDNATLAVPAGIAVVTVETAKAAKVLVK